MMMQQQNNRKNAKHIYKDLFETADKVVKPFSKAQDGKRKWIYINYY